MASLSNKSVTGFTSAQSITTSRTKLYGIQYIVETGYHASGTNVPSLGTAIIDGSTFEFKDGNSSGSIIFKFTAMTGNNGYHSGLNPESFMFGNNYLLFENGIYSSGVGASSESNNNIDGDLVTVSFIYELG